MPKRMSAHLVMMAQAQRATDTLNVSIGESDALHT